MNTRSFVLGLGLLPFACLLLGDGSAIAAYGEEIPEVGIGAVHPICDPSMSECISSDEQIQDELIAELEADDQINAARKDIELGELRCDSLNEAPGSTLLRFEISSTETVTAERTSFTSVDGDAFADGKERKVWKGDVVDPAPSNDASPRAISMTWGSPCDVETFLLKMISVNPDGTTSITTSVPCEAGSTTEICMMQFDIDLPNPTEPLVAAEKDDPPVIPGTTRHLTENSPISEPPTRRVQAEEESMSGRRLQSTTQIDVMFLYSGDALTRVSGGATAAAMQTLIVNELPKATEAATNSDIDLQFNLVHAGPLPYDQSGVGSSAASSELSTLRTSNDVKNLRDTYAADLVVLVGSFSGTCGLGYVNHNTQVSAEGYGFSLIDARCFDGTTTTHEMGHNLGCLHDTANNGLAPVNDYSHGMRYCTGSGTRFHTIMAYYCYYNAPAGYTGDFVPALNHFSNPDVNYNGVPTGSATANNARTVRENMDAVSRFRVGCQDDSDCKDTGTCVNGSCGTSECSTAGGNVQFAGIGYCYAPNNIPECGYDGGDCCECDCRSSGYECGVNGYNCLNPYSECFGACETDAECDTGSGEICCPTKKVCEVPLEGTNPAACGDPHMTGFLGQKFDFTGLDGEWYCLVKDSNVQVSMRVTSPVSSLPEITYITGLSVLTTDVEGLEHDIVIQVKDPHTLDSSCPEGVFPCLADGSLSVLLDGEEKLLAPGTVSLGQDVALSAVNLPGECRSFGFEQYWERKMKENAAQGRRLLGKELDMGEWILGDPTATNMEECIEYVVGADTNPGGLFAHQSEHATFQIVTPKATIRLNHGRLHQVAMRDPTDQFDLPDHKTWQMNVGLEHNAVSHTATGILGETFVPTLDAAGNRIMFGMESIRGEQDDYRLEGPLEVGFVQDRHDF